MSVETVEVRAGTYQDSVTLMQASRAVADAPGVTAALVAMGTELNLSLLEGMGFGVPAGTGANDLVVAVRAADEEGLGAGLAALEQALRPAPASSSGAAEELPPRTTGAAARRQEATLALVSVPGEHAFTEAVDALEAGLSVMVFSDNVPLEQEVRLKDEAARRGLLVMGPDCGTAVVGGVGLGFANVVRPGPVGLVAASGTGSQQLMCLLDGAGVGVSHCLGVGGRDLSSAVGGRSTRQALAMLDEDPATELIVVVSKPPAPEVAEEIEKYAATLRTPVQLALLGRGQPDLTEAARTAVLAVGGSWQEPRSWPAAGGGADRRPGDAPGGRRRGPLLRGLFAGGTLCDEAMVLAAEALGPVRSNIPLDPAWALDPAARSHTMVDYGEDEMTRGRAHPMIDPSLRLAALSDAASDPDVGVLLLDVVLGHGAHPDPAADLAPVLTEAVASTRADGRDLAVVVSLCGTSGDPQGLDRQAEALAAAGAAVHLSNAAATRAAVALVTEGVA